MFLTADTVVIMAYLLFILGVFLGYKIISDSFKRW
jgi:Sec-independent protein secretion pathway component TatC